MERMDLRLRSEAPQHVGIPGADLELDLALGEEIRVEISTKFRTHLIAEELTDAGFGVEAAARQFGLDFIDLATEHYLLVCHKDSLDQGNMKQLLALMRAPEFLAEIERLPGYAPDRCGEVCTFAQLLASDRA